MGSRHYREKTFEHNGSRQAELRNPMRNRSDRQARENEAGGENSRNRADFFVVRDGPADRKENQAASRGLGPLQVIFNLIFLPLRRTVTSTVSPGRYFRRASM